ncbi:hypothetical protein SAPIO_CDS6623 [Scedosporium apiospermum]|uniref:Uncharacterized protein n=1 Tax=Pseudallescheria apiosperma TaxID=563466 RepID=A0A084G3K8_PSEDA|nr:uncharacterized protein SAPIO_CDS6623 [Scedosporium apiospermum]KEZ41920.1 hypothetical protein SAPIO_CDS6623 [Scedosporium apiospermum]
MNPPAQFGSIPQSGLPVPQQIPVTQQGAPAHVPPNGTRQLEISNPDYDPLIDTSSSSQKEEPYPTKRTSCLDVNIGEDNWLFECLSLLLSIACIGAIAAVLGTMDNRPLSQWHMPINPNALISIFATVAKAALLYPVAECISQFKWLYFRRYARKTIDMQRFDDASRGPWGSFCLLWHSKRRDALAVIGCIITILALAIDPFAQQIVSFPSRTVPSDTATAWIRRAQAYDSGTIVRTGLAKAQQIEPGMQGAILMGIYGKAGDPHFSCPTGNCTFPDLSTLGVCASCEDVTAESKSKCAPGNGASIISTCNVTTPGGFQLSATYGKGSSATSYWTNLNSTAARGNGSVSLATFALMKGPPDKHGAVNDERTVSECSIRFCERTYRAFRVTDGSPDAPSYNFRDINMTSVLSIENAPTATYVGYGTLPATDKPTNSFVINSADFNAISATLIALFTTSRYSDNAQDSSGGLDERGFDISNTLFQSTNLSHLMDNLADRMSDYIRSVTATDLVFINDAVDDAAAMINATTVTVEGISFREETYVHVSWPWFILPAGVVFAAAVFLLLTIIVNRASRGQIWKSSILPYIYHPLSGEMVAEQNSLEKLGEMSERASRTRARLFRYEDGHLRLAVS